MKSTFIAFIALAMANTAMAAPVHDPAKREAAVSHFSEPDIQSNETQFPVLGL